MKKALTAWGDAIGPDHVRTDGDTLARYMANVSGLEADVPAVLLPASTDEVRRVVLAANDHRIALHPISRGKNWGMGSRLPVRSGTVVLDLSRMNRIRELNAEHHYAVVEPGVTQGQLHGELQSLGLPLYFNVTGSGLETSLIGNALERGVGYFASRAEALSGLEVVLGNGTVLNTGCGHFPTSAITHLYKYGLGPYLDGVFAQSNYGIVTAAGMELLPRGEADMAIIAKIPVPGRLPAFVQALTDLRKREVIRTAVHIGNRERTVSTLGPLVYEQLAADPAYAGKDLMAETAAIITAEGFGPWSAVAGVSGSPAELKAAGRAVRRALRGIADVTFLNDRKIAFARRLTERFAGLAAFKRKGMILRAIEPLYGLSKGIPTDQPLKSVYWLAGDTVPASGELDPDRGRAGFLYCLPMIPMSGRDAQVAVAETERIFDSRRFAAYITFNMVNAKALEGVINLAFDRSDAARTADALQCVEELNQRFVELGYIPYRLGIQAMAGIVQEDDPFWRVARDLKQVFDPNHIIAPGRYNLV